MKLSQKKTKTKHHENYGDLFQNSPVGEKVIKFIEWYNLNTIKFAVLCAKFEF